MPATRTGDHTCCCSLWLSGLALFFWLLCGCARVFIHLLPVRRPIPYHFKGLPTEYRQYVLDTQMQQAQATHQQKLEQKKDDAAWDDFMLKQNTEALKIETAIERERGNQRRELKNFLRVQAEETSAKCVVTSRSSARCAGLPVC